MPLLSSRNRRTPLRLPSSSPPDPAPSTRRPSSFFSATHPCPPSPTPPHPPVAPHPVPPPNPPSSLSAVAPSSYRSFSGRPTSHTAPAPRTPSSPRPDPKTLASPNPRRWRRLRLRRLYSVGALFVSIAATPSSPSCRCLHRAPATASTSIQTSRHPRTGINPGVIVVTIAHTRADASVDHRQRPRRRSNPDDAQIGFNPSATVVTIAHPPRASTPPSSRMRTASLVPPSPRSSLPQDEGRLAQVPRGRKLQRAPRRLQSCPWKSNENKGWI